MRIAFVGAQDRPHELACTHWSGIKSAKTEHDVKVFCCRSGEGFVDDIIKWQPEILVYNLIDMALNEPARVKLRKELPNTKIVFWYTDCRTPETDQITVDISKTVDLFLVSNDGLKDFQAKHFGMTPQFLPQAVTPIDAPVITKEASYDFLFIGGKINRGGFEKRMELITDLERNHGLTVLNGRTVNERAKLYKAMPRLYSSSTFTLDVSHFWHIPKYTSNRFWVIPGFWGFSLTKRFPQHEELYPEKVRVYWDTVEELMDIIDYYRHAEKERKDMIKKGWEWTVNHHTYAHRINRIVEILSK
jgi:spore maturation protein CgeB